MKLIFASILSTFALMSTAPANIASKSYVEDIVSALDTAKEDKSNKLTAYAATPATGTYYNAAVVNSALDAKVGKTGNETIEGNKTFTGTVIVPTQTLP